MFAVRIQTSKIRPRDGVSERVWRGCSVPQEIGRRSMIATTESPGETGRRVLESIWIMYDPKNCAHRISWVVDAVEKALRIRIVKAGVFSL
jgi:hypothetical protein